MKKIEIEFVFYVLTLNYKWISKHNILHNTRFHIGQNYIKSTYNDNLVINNNLREWYNKKMFKQIQCHFLHIFFREKKVNYFLSLDS